MLKGYRLNLKELPELPFAIFLSQNYKFKNVRHLGTSKHWIVSDNNELVLIYHGYVLKELFSLEIH